MQAQLEMFEEANTQQQLVKIKKNEEEMGRQG